MVNFEMRFNDSVFANGQVLHVPRIGDSVKLSGYVFTVADVVWEYDQAFIHNVKATVMLSLKENNDKR